MKKRARVPQAPQITLERERGFYSALGYRAARVATRDGRTPSGGGSKLHEIDREKLQWQSREFRRDNGIYAGMIRRARAFITGNGFKLQCQTRAPRWNEQVEAAFADWWRRPEITGMLSGSQVEDLVTDELLTCGEIPVALTTENKANRLQVFEAEQLRGPNPQDDGIERDAFGRPTRYWICPYRKDGNPDTTKKQAYQPGTLLYIASLERPSASRAVPPCQAAFPMLHRINDVCDSEAVAWQMQSKFAVAITRKSGLPLATQVAHEDASVSSEEAEGSPASNFVTELDLGLIFHGDQGDEVKGIDRTAPASTFSDTLTMFFRLLGLPLGLPLELMLLDWTKSNYSQSRAVLEQAKVTFLAWQDLLEAHFYRPVFMWWLQGEIDAGRISDRKDKFDHDWLAPQPPWIDQLAEAQAHGERLDRGLETWAQAQKSQNADPEKMRAALIAEEVAAFQACDEVETQTEKKYRPPIERFLGRKPPDTPKPAAPAPQQQPQQPAVPAK